MLKEARHNRMKGRTSSHAAIRVAAISLQGINSTLEIIIAHMHSHSLAAAISSRSREVDIPDNPVHHTVVVDTVAVVEDLATAAVAVVAADSMVAAVVEVMAAAADIKTQKKSTL
jgi:ribosome-binding factor A